MERLRELLGAGAWMDEVVIESFFTFDALTTVKAIDSRSVVVHFQFVVRDLQQLQIVGSLFEKGQVVEIHSTLLAGRQVQFKGMAITSIKMQREILSWECVAAIP